MQLHGDPTHEGRMVGRTVLRRVASRRVGVCHVAHKARI